jgi:hypothetical protein
VVAVCCKDFGLDQLKAVSDDQRVRELLDDVPHPTTCPLHPGPLEPGRDPAKLANACARHPAGWSSGFRIWRRPMDVSPDVSDFGHAQGCLAALFLRSYENARSASNLAFSTSAHISDFCDSPFTLLQFLAIPPKRKQCQRTKNLSLIGTDIERSSTAFI